MLLVQGYRLGRGQPEYEIRGEARGIALDLLIEALGSAAAPGSPWTAPANNCLIYREMRAKRRRPINSSASYSMFCTCSLEDPLRY